MEKEVENGHSVIDKYNLPTLIYTCFAINSRNYHFDLKNERKGGMRNIFKFLLIVYLTFIMSTLAFATDTGLYQINELDMSIDIPNDYIVFTRDINANDPNLIAYGITKDSMISLMESGNIYLNAWDEDVNYEIIVTMVDSPLGDFNQFSDTTISALLSGMASTYKENDITYIKSEIYQHSQAKFLKIYISQPYNGSTAYGLQYYTVYANKAINITIQSYSGSIDSTKESILKGIVDTAHFATEPIKSEMPSATFSFTYIDTDSEVSFTVPANWVESPMTEERDFIDAKFTSNLEEGLSIIYRSTDVWDEMSTSEKAGYSRTDISNSIFTKADAAEMLGISENKIILVTYGDKEYFEAEVSKSGLSYGLDVSVTITYLFRYEDGYMYTFQFGGIGSNKYYSDFEALLNSVKYDVGTPDDTDNFFSNSLMISILISLLITIIIHPLPIYIYRHSIKKAPISPKTAKIITIVDAVLVFIVMLIISSSDSGRVSSAAIILWSYVCYRILTKGYLEPTGLEKNNLVYGQEEERAIIEDQNEIEEILLPSNQELLSTNNSLEGSSSKVAPNDGNESIQEAPVNNEEKQHQVSELLFCHKCRNKLKPEDIFCNKCGIKLNDSIKEGK